MNAHAFAMLFRTDARMVSGPRLEKRIAKTPRLGAGTVSRERVCSDCGRRVGGDRMLEEWLDMEDRERGGIFVW